MGKKPGRNYLIFSHNGDDVSASSSTSSVPKSPEEGYRTVQSDGNYNLPVINETKSAAYRCRLKRRNGGMKQCNEYETVVPSSKAIIDDTRSPLETPSSWNEINSFTEAPVCQPWWSAQRAARPGDFFCVARHAWTMRCRRW